LDLSMVKEATFNIVSCQGYQTFSAPSQTPKQNKLAGLSKLFFSLVIFANKTRAY
jgi:hypothetical protein